MMQSYSICFQGRKTCAMSPVAGVLPLTRTALMPRRADSGSKSIAPSTRRVTRPSRSFAVGPVAAQKAKFASFEDMLSQSELVLVDFYATWCGPCVMMSKIMEEASSSLKHVKLVKIDTEKYPALASKHNINALPTLVLFRNGKAVGRQEGVLSAADLKRWIDHVAQIKSG